jgi:DNA topoisomerase-2
MASAAGGGRGKRAAVAVPARANIKAAMRVGGSTAAAAALKAVAAAGGGGTSAVCDGESDDDGEADCDVTGPGGATHVRITELPIGRWTEDYKAFLQGLVARGLVRAVREYHSEASAEFLVSLSPAGVEAALDARGGLPAFFKLASSVSTRNMHLFDAAGAIQRYASPGHVLADFVPIRAAVYEARLVRQLNVAADVADRAAAKHRFLSEVTRGTLPLLGGATSHNDGRRATKADLAALLAQRGFPAITAGGAYPASSATDAPARAPPHPPPWHAAAHLLAPPVLHERRLQPLAAGAPVPAGGYDYLLNLPVWQLTPAAVATSAADVTRAQRTLDAAKAATPLAAWRADLTALAAALRRGHV